MVGKGVGRVVRYRFKDSKGRTYEKTWIYIPTSVANDTAFPFKPGEKVLIIIDIKGKRLIIEKLEKEGNV